MRLLAQRFEIEPELTARLNALSRTCGATLYITLLTAFKVLLHRYSGQDRIAVGAPISNRTHSELEGLIGFFVNSLVMYTDISGGITFTEALQRAHDRLERADGRSTEIDRVKAAVDAYEALQSQGRSAQESS